MKEKLWAGNITRGHRGEMSLWYVDMTKTCSFQCFFALNVPFKPLKACIECPALNLGSSLGQCKQSFGKKCVLVLSKNETPCCYVTCPHHSVFGQKHGQSIVCLCWPNGWGIQLIGWIGRCLMFGHALWPLSLKKEQGCDPRVGELVCSVVG